MFKSGVIIVEYQIDEIKHVDTWDGSINVKYIKRVLECRNATNIKIRIAN